MIVQAGDRSVSGTIPGSNSDLRLPGARAERNSFWLRRPQHSIAYLHKESVLVAVVLEQIVVQLGSDSLPVAAVQVPNCRRRHVVLALYRPGQA
jgi:hypothetical protein